MAVESAPFRAFQAQLLKKFYGYDQLRPKQQDAVDAVLSGHDVNMTAPTGYGKSICFILPALVKFYLSSSNANSPDFNVPTDSGQRAVTLVVSPLLALISDQVSALRRRHIPVAMISSGQSDKENTAVLKALEKGDQFPYALVYITAERVTSAGFLDKLYNLYHRNRLGAFAIDESHCISQWGHDFRKSYSQLGILRKAFPTVPIIALTATATPKVSDSIVESLAIPNAKRVHESFLRSNIRYEVRYVDGELCNTTVIADIIKYIQNRPNDAGVIYAHKRETVEDLVSELAEARIKCVGFHAGMTINTKKSVQQDFETGKAQIIVATTAFGMGIDKADVRFVINHSLPSSIEAYFQESGRAGRDGKPSESVLYFGHEDARLKVFLASQARQDRRSSFSLTTQKAVDAMITYCESVRCRRVTLLAHFGEIAKAGDICGTDGCDVCANPKSVVRRMRPLLEKNGRRTRRFSSDVSSTFTGIGKCLTPAAEFHSALTFERMNRNSNMDDVENIDEGLSPNRDLTFCKRMANKTVAELAEDEENHLAEVSSTLRGPKSRLAMRLRESSKPLSAIPHFQPAKSMKAAASEQPPESAKAGSLPKPKAPKRRLQVKHSLRKADDIAGFSSDSSPDVRFRERNYKRRCA